VAVARNSMYETVIHCSSRGSPGPTEISSNVGYQLEAEENLPGHEHEVEFEVLSSSFRRSDHGCEGGTITARAKLRRNLRPVKRIDWSLCAP